MALSQETFIYTKISLPLSQIKKIDNLVPGDSKSNRSFYAICVLKGAKGIVQTKSIRVQINYILIFLLYLDLSVIL